MADRRIDIEARWNGESLRRGTRASGQDLDNFLSTAKRGLLALAGSYGWQQTARRAAEIIRGQIIHLSEESDATRRLTDDLKRLGVEAPAELQRVTDSVRQMTRASSLSYVESAGALRRLLKLTGDYAGSVKNVNLVLDIASDENVGLATAVQAVAFAMKGQISRAALLVPGLKDVIKKTKDLGDTSAVAADALDELQRRYGGGARAELESYGGAWDQVKKSLQGVVDSSSRLLAGGGEGGFTKFILQGTRNIDSLTSALNRNAGGFRTGARWVLRFMTLGFSDAAFARVRAMRGEYEKQERALTALEKHRALVESISQGPKPVFDLGAPPGMNEPFAGTIFAPGAKGRPQPPPVIVSQADKIRLILMDAEKSTHKIRINMQDTATAAHLYRDQMEKIPDIGADINHRMQTLNSLIGQQLQGTISGALMTGAIQGGQAMVAYLKDLFLRELFTNLAAGILNALSGGTMGTFSILGQAVGLNNPGTSAGRGPFSNSIQQQQLWRLQRG